MGEPSNRKKGRSRHGHGAYSDWIVKGKKRGRKASIELGYEGGKRKRKWFYGPNDATLDEQISKFRALQKAGVNVAAPKLSLAAYLDDWIENVIPLTVRPITVDSYAQKLRTHVYPVVGKVPLTELQPPHLLRLFAGMQRKELSRRTIQYTRAILRKAMQDAVAHNVIPYNVVDRVKVAKPAKKDAVAIDPANIESVCAAIDDDWLYGFFYVAIASGCRRAELCALRWDDVDWKARAIRIDESTEELRKDKGGIIYGEPKSIRSRRTVPLNTEAMVVLAFQRELQERRQLELGDAWKGGEFVFTRQNGLPLRPSTVSNHWRSIRKRAGVADVKLHGLRHTHATMLLLAGVHPRVVMERLGHSTIAIGQDLYSHVMKTMQDAVVEEMEAIMPKARRAT